MNGGRYPGMPFNQQMSCPYEFKLRKYGYNSYRIFALPIQEIEALRGEARSWSDLTVKPGENPLNGLSGDAWDIVAEIEPGAASEIGFKFRGWDVRYAAKEKELASSSLKTQLALNNGKLVLRILVIARPWKYSAMEARR